MSHKTKRRLLPPGDAPSWMNRFAYDIERHVEAPAEAPIGIHPFENAAALPPASRYPFHVVYVEDIATLAISDGTDWFPLTKGAAL